MEVFDPAGNRKTKSRHYFYGYPSTDYGLLVPWWIGKEFRAEDFDTNGNTMLRLTESDWRQRVPSWCNTWWPCSSNPTEAAPTNSPFIVESKVTVLDGNLVSKTSVVNPSNGSWAFDAYNNPTDQWAYDFGVGQPGPLKRHIQTSYINYASALSGLYLLGLSSGTNVYGVDSNGQEILASSTQTYFDEYGPYPLLTYGPITGWQDPGSARGNPTTTRFWLNTNNTWLAAHAQFDQLGNVRKTWDRLGRVSETSFFDAFSDNTNRNTYAFPTMVTSPPPDPTGQLGSPTGLVATKVYDYSTGLVYSSTDPNGQTTSFRYNDLLDRPKQIIRAEGTTITNQATFNYDDANRVITTTCDLNVNNDNVLVARILYDGLGRTVESRQYEGGTNYIAVQTQYDALGRPHKTSNPFRPWKSEGALWTTTVFDALGRKASVTTPDNATVYTFYSSNLVLVKDQIGKERISKSDALGRLTDVWEITNGDDSTESVSFPNHPEVTAGYRTKYAYDGLDNLTTVTQRKGTAGVLQTRTFAYDSLRRLTSASNPESGTITYQYDANSNLTQKTDARGIQTTFAYDALNRSTTVDYSNTAVNPDVTRAFDNPTSGANGKGRFWYSYAGGNYTSGSTVEHMAIDSHDALGRPRIQRQVFKTNGSWGQGYATQRSYNLADRVTSQTYPSGRIVNYSYDNAGRTTGFTGNLGDGVTRTYSSSIWYSSSGSLQEEQFGTQTPLFHKLHYNKRLQLFDIRLSLVAWQTDQWNWNRGAIVNYYATADLACQTGECRANSGTDNNGNVIQSQHWVPANDQMTSYNWTEDRFTYDALNRLKSVAEYHGFVSTGLSGVDFTQVYDYDRSGNRTINQTLTQGYGAPKPWFAVTEANNRLGVPAGQTGNMSYDLAGNLTNDNYSPLSFGSSNGTATRTFDAENRLTEARDGNQQVVSSYGYNADGQRVRRKAYGIETLQVYGMDGDLLAEYKSGAATFIPTKEYGYRNGQLAVTMASGDDVRLSRFITNLYYGALQRDPTTQELQDKMNQLAGAGAQGQSQLLTTASQIARSLFVQTNYETSPPARTDVQYVSDLYYAYLQRGPDDGGLSWWAGQAASSRVNVCNAFEASSEFATLVSTLYGTAASDNERTEHFVNNFYLGAYGRNATSTELQQQRDSLNAAAGLGLTQVQAQAESFGRSLFTSQLNDASLSNTQFVTNLYEAFLQRGPDAGGLGFWSGQATVGQGRQNVLNAFATCGPFYELAGTLYREAFWLVADHLGTPRMIVNKSGSLAGIKRHDYLPFGEEIAANAAGRTPAQGYSQDNVRQKFTQKERDIETGLDYFGARYYASIQGRFTSADPLLSSGAVESPQSWNRYSYVLNNPLRFIDPDGLYEFDSSVSEEQRKKFNEALTQARANLQQIAKDHGTNSQEYKKAERALGVYGAEGVKNGVLIFAKEGAGGGRTGVEGVAGPRTADNPTGQNIRIAFDPSQFESTTFGGLIGHEGSHAADGSDWVKSGFANSANPTTYQSEVDAFTVQSALAQARSPNSYSYVSLPSFKEPSNNFQYFPVQVRIWDSGWKEADRATMRRANIDRILSRPKHAGGDYGLTSTSKEREFKKGSRF
jgi:RHS repeat-associated protein